MVNRVHARIPVNLLFLVFVWIQFVYLFGGQANISAEGYTYAEYARRGFFDAPPAAGISGRVVGRAQQRRVQHIRPVGGGDENDALVGFKPVHFHQKLIQGLFSLIMSAPETCTTMTTNGIDLINEDDTWRMLLCLTK